MGTPINLPSAKAVAKEIQVIGPWDGARVAAPDVALAQSSTPDADHAILHSWRQLLDLGTLQTGEENLAGTSRPAHVVISSARAARLGVSNSELVTVSTARGAITVPAQIGSIEESAIWLPRNSDGSQCIATLGAASGIVVKVAKA